MARYPYLTRAGPRGISCFRRTVPQRLCASIGKREILVSFRPRISAQKTFRSRFTTRRPRNPADEARSAWLALFVSITSSHRLLGSRDRLCSSIQNTRKSTTAAAPPLRPKSARIDPAPHRHREHVSTALCTACGSSAHGHIIELARMTVIVADFLTGMGRRNRRGSARRAGPRLAAC